MLVPPAVAAQEALPAAAEGGVTSRPRRNLRIVLTAEVYEELELLADTLRVETVRCLIGVAQGDSLLIDLAWRPPIHHSTPTGVAYGLCPVATISLWHNHPWTREFEPEYSCYLSQTDIRAAIQSRAPHPNGAGDGRGGLLVDACTGGNVCGRSCDATASPTVAREVPPVERLSVRIANRARRVLAAHEPTPSCPFSRLLPLRSRAPSAWSPYHGEARGGV